MEENYTFSVCIEVCVNDENAYNGTLATCSEEKHAMVIAQALSIGDTWKDVVPDQFLDDEKCTLIAIAVEWKDNDGDFDESFRVKVYSK